MHIATSRYLPYWRQWPQYTPLYTYLIPLHFSSLTYTNTSLYSFDALLEGYFVICFSVLLFLVFTIYTNAHTITSLHYHFIVDAPAKHKAVITSSRTTHEQLYRHSLLFDNIRQFTCHSRLFPRGFTTSSITQHRHFHHFLSIRPYLIPYYLIGNILILFQSNKPLTFHHHLNIHHLIHLAIYYFICFSFIFDFYIFAYR